MQRITFLSCSCLAFLTACGEVVSPGAQSSDAAPQPTAASVSPDHGPIIGGIDVTVTGTGFAGGEDVMVLVGGILSPEATATSDGEVTFELPPGVLENDIVDVTVFNQNGSAFLPDAFTYNPRPVVLTIDPVLARKAGSTNLTITGRGFDSFESGAPTVMINGVAAVGVTVVDDETLTLINAADVTAVPGAAVDLVVSNANGSDSLDDHLRLTAPGLLAMGRTRSNPVVYYVDLATGNVNVLARLPKPVSICALSPSGVLFARAGNNQVGHSLVTVDLEANTVTTLGSTRDSVASAARKLRAMTFVGATLFGITSEDTRLVTVNQTTGVTTVVNAAGTSLNAQFGIAVRDGTSLWFGSGLGGTLDTIQTGTGVKTLGPSMAGTSTQQTHGMVTIGSTVYVGEYFGSNRIFSVNTTTAVLTPVATLPSPIAGICETPPTF